MNKRKHTPGPWAVEHPYGEGGIYVSGTNTALIAKIYHEQEANARLIAAAPDMLAALKGIIDQACCNGCPEHENARTGNITVRHTPECEAAMAAIAKAEGGA